MSEDRVSQLPERRTVTSGVLRKDHPPRTQRKRRRAPLGARIAGLGVAAALTVFGGPKIADHILPDTTPEKPGIALQLPPSASQVKQEGITDLEEQASKYIFNNLNSQEAIDVEKKIAQMNEVILGNPSFPEMVQVVADLEPLIDAASKEYGIPKQVVYGMILIENGGGHDLVSPAGALGPTQLMPDAATEMGLRVDPSTGSGQAVDERLDPKKAIPAMLAYIAKYRDLFGDNIGISVWNYHAGPGNVGEAIRLYFLDTEGIDIGELDFKVYGDLNKDRKLNVYRLLTNPKVGEQLLSRLEDETKLYPAKAAAGARLYKSEQAKNLISANME